ncbi:hypothetical protein HDU86_005029 [Geranomyces michiganensis]|nr:hypothetical protein HDU86_005029 [Geranomyces michiganensis]
MKLTGTVALALALCVGSAAAAAVPSSATVIPISWSAPNVTLYDAYPDILANAARKYGGTVPAEFIPAPSVWAANKLGNAGVYIFHGPITIGGQMMEMLFDTGSSDTWVCDASAPSLPSAHKYDRKKSKTFKNIGGDFSIQYGSGSASGKTASEEITIAGVTVKGQTFATITAGTEFGGDYFDGIFGMGFPSISNMKTRSWIENAMLQKTVTSTVFGFYHNENGGSELVVSGYNPNHINGNIAWIPLSGTPSYWLVEVLDIRRNGATINPTRFGGKTNAAVDTGTSLIHGPSADITKLNNLIGAKVVNGRWTIPCDKRNAKDKVEFSLRGTTLSFTANEYIIKNSDQDCISTFAPIDMDMWIMGLTALRKYYSIYDMGDTKNGYKGARVGLALAKAYS